MTVSPTARLESLRRQRRQRKLQELIAAGGDSLAAAEGGRRLTAHTPDDSQDRSGHDSGGDGGEVGGAAGLSHQRSVFAAVGLSFEPLYECAHIFRTLQCFGELTASYNTRRKEELLGAELELQQQLSASGGQLEEIFGPQYIEQVGGLLLHPPLPLLGGSIGMERGCRQTWTLIVDGYIEQVDHYFKQLAGFFVLEDAVLHSGREAAVNGAAAVDGLWDHAVRQCAELLRTGFGRLGDAGHMLQLKRAADNFVALLAAHDFYVDPLLNVLEQTRAPFEAAVLRRHEVALHTALEQADWAPLEVASTEQWVELIEPHRQSLLAHRDPTVHTTWTIARQDGPNHLGL